jgi:hypothetical protein
MPEKESASEYRRGRSSRLATREETTQYHQKMQEILADYQPAPVVSGFEVVIEPLAATYEKGELRIAVRVTGVVERPEFVAHCKGAVSHIVVPAKVEMTDDSGEL